MNELTSVTAAQKLADGHKAQFQQWASKAHPYDLLNAVKVYAAVTHITHQDALDTFQKELSPRRNPYPTGR